MREADARHPPDATGQSVNQSRNSVMFMAMVKVLVDIRPSLVALPFHRAFTRPVVEIDGVEWPARWGTTEIPVDAELTR